MCKKNYRRGRAFTLFQFLGVIYPKAFSSSSFPVKSKSTVNVAVVIAVQLDVVVDVAIDVRPTPPPPPPSSSSMSLSSSMPLSTKQFLLKLSICSLSLYLSLAGLAIFGSYLLESRASWMGDLETMMIVIHPLVLVLVLIGRVCALCPLYRFDTLLYRDRKATNQNLDRSHL
jgi:hypothetical protein